MLRKGKMNLAPMIAKLKQAQMHSLICLKFKSCSYKVFMHVFAPGTINLPVIFIYPISPKLNGLSNPAKFRIPLKEEAYNKSWQCRVTKSKIAADDIIFVLKKILLVNNWKTDAQLLTPKTI